MRYKFVPPKVPPHYNLTVVGFLFETDRLSDAAARGSSGNNAASVPAGRLRLNEATLCGSESGRSRQQRTHRREG